jgi:hypothetical protein
MRFFQPVEFFNVTIMDSPTSKHMFSLSYLLLAVIGNLLPAGWIWGEEVPGLSGSWIFDYEEAIRRASEKDQPVLMMFSAQWFRPAAR